MAEWQQSQLEVARLGEASRESPLDDALAAAAFVSDEEGIRVSAKRSASDVYFEAAGPRRKIYFDPSRTRAAIVTCGGLCPGLNDVIRAITTMLIKGYGVREVLGLRYGYRGLIPRYGYEPEKLTLDSIDGIHRQGGTVLRSSRGEQSPEAMVDFLLDREIDILFTIGGEGTQQAALAIHKEVRRRDAKVAVVGVPKTIDNDIPLVERSFGFETAVQKAVEAVDAGHIEARGYPGGVAIVRLMGRDSGFIAAAASLASGDVNCCLIPEVPFSLDGPDGLIECVKTRLTTRGHAVIVVAEGAGRELREESGYDEIGLFLRDRLNDAMIKRGIEIKIRYIDPSYMVRSGPANADDSVFCATLAANAVHAGMSGRTSMLVGYSGGQCTHVPFGILEGRRRVDPTGDLWRSVLESTGQPKSMN